jgi:glyoxylase-like metal-dependent hydrolase (beta-lactamase superfamily II)
MFSEITEIIHEGDVRGNGMAIRMALPSGLVIFGFATPNTYGGDWDHGPTWNYLVCADQPFLVDTGRWGMGDRLLGMICDAGVSPRDITSIVITHGHEDHDGGLGVVAEATGAAIQAHPIYRRLLQPYPEHAPDDFRSRFPASCWRCFMPESFTEKHCARYHRERCTLPIGAIGEGHSEIDPSLATLHLPGHTPDSVALLVGDQVLLPGDVILPKITTFPTSESDYDCVEAVLPPGYDSVESLYGLRAYLRSLETLHSLSDRHPDLVVLPGHRLFWDGHWNELDLGQRVAEIIQHHLERFGAILDILADGPMTARQITELHFDDKLLEGYGIIMAEHEILSHCELLIAAGDVVASGDLIAAGDVVPADGACFEATGRTDFPSVVEALEPW